MLLRSCVFIGDLYGLSGEHPFEPMAQLADFIRARREFAYGEMRDYWDDARCVGWVRIGDEKHDGCAVVISIGDEGTKRMEVGKVSLAPELPLFLLLLISFPLIFFHSLLAHLIMSC